MNGLASPLVLGLDMEDHLVPWRTSVCCNLVIIQSRGSQHRLRWIGAKDSKNRSPPKQASPVQVGVFPSALYNPSEAHLSLPHHPGDNGGRQADRRVVRETLAASRAPGKGGPQPPNRRFRCSFGRREARQGHHELSGPQHLPFFPIRFFAGETPPGRFPSAGG